MPLEQAHVIDIIALDPATDEVALVMTETRPWDGSDARLFELQEKINAYLSFALDGEMAEAYPRFAGKRVRLELRCATPPDARTAHFIGIVRGQIAFQEIKFEVVLAPAEQCGCATGSSDVAS
jgi:uncharacterized protein DUF6572